MQYKKICERDIELQILNDEVESMSDLHDEIITYKKNPKKAMKMMDKRIKKLGKQIKIKQKENKKNMLCELTMGPLYGIDYTYPDEEEFDDFSDAFHIFDTVETGEYCAPTKCKCDACIKHHRNCLVKQEAKRLWRRENGWDTDIDYDSESDSETVILDNNENPFERLGGESTDEEDDLIYERDSDDMSIDSDMPSLIDAESEDDTRDVESPNTILNLTPRRLVQQTNWITFERGEYNPENAFDDYIEMMRYEDD